jgi:hypothetical protein
MYSYLIIVIALNVLPSGNDDRPLMDFGSFYAAGLKIQNGDNPYDPNSAYIFDVVFPKVNAGGKMVNLNPPISVALFSVLARFDPAQTIQVWRTVSFLIYVICALALARLYRQTLTAAKFIWAFALAGFWHTLVLGQIYVFLLAFATAAWYFMKKEMPIMAGIALGAVIAMKPNFALWAIFLFFAGQWMLCIAATISAVVISAIPILLYGVDIYAQWIEASAVEHATLIMPGNNSMMGLTARFDLDGAGILLGILIAVLLLYRSTRLPTQSFERLESVSSMGILAALLASPIAWTGYTILLLPAFFSFKKWTPLIIAAAVILSIPFAVILQIWQASFVNFVIFGWLYGWALLCLVAEFARNATATSAIHTN